MFPTLGVKISKCSRKLTMDDFFGRQVSLPRGTPVMSRVETPSGKIIIFYSKSCTKKIKYITKYQLSMNALYSTCRL